MIPTGTTKQALSRFVKAYIYVDGKLEPAPNMYSEGTVSTEQTYCEGAIGLNGPIEDYAKFCQMLLNKGEFNERRILKPETIDLMTKVNRLPEQNSGAKVSDSGLASSCIMSKRNQFPKCQIMHLPGTDCLERNILSIRKIK
jgi:CubicO group peptidase (beta-lactamase class C family)